MHERSPRDSHIDTVLYEIGMLRHCARLVPEKKVIADRATADYNLAIEGFLLHLRNLLEFVTKQAKFETDLRIDKPDQWAGRSVQPNEYSDLVERAKGLDCYDQISKYLQHCTTHRHERAKSWDIAKIFADIDPVLQDFVKRFASEPSVSGDPVLGVPANSTVTPSSPLQLPKYEAF